MAEMQPTTEILARIGKNSHANKNEVFTRLYRYLLRPDIYFEAYKRLYANNGASTRGVNNDTADGFSEAKIAKIIQSLSNETYFPNPVRRTYIDKGNGKKRPLGIPTFTDKLVQEALRMVLEAVYEPVFSYYSHGFRPNQSCHTALSSLKNEFTGARWFVEGDIKGCFDNIDHAVLISVLNKKVKDARIVKLIYKFLKAGYMENWQYHNTYSGTPQGGIISPLLANIYLNELDTFVMKLKAEFDRPRQTHSTYEYGVLKRKMNKIRKAVENADSDERGQLIAEYKATRAQLLKTPAKSQTDKKIKYIRYADDFVIAVNGSREDCVDIKRRLSEFIRQFLKMELSEEKTLITHSTNCARFLGYDVRVRRNGKVKRGGRNGSTKRTLSNNTELLIPFEDKIMGFLFSRGIVKQKPNGTVYPTHRPALLRMTDLEIVMAYNAELRGICNYYGIASNYDSLGYFTYLMEYSCLRTLAGKHKSSVSKIIEKFKDGYGSWGIPYTTKKGKKICYLAKLADCKGAKSYTDILPKAFAMYMGTRNTLENRLKAKVCELCGTSNAEHYEVHHIHKVKDLKGKEPWKIAMIAKRRKTMVVCRSCHNKIHH